MDDTQSFSNWRKAMKNKNLVLAVCKGHLVAFTYDRIQSDELLDGLYKYDIQSTDDGFDPIAIKEHIFVNHWGTLISKVPLPLDSHGWIMFENDTDFIELPHMVVKQEEYLNLPDEVIQAFLNQNNQEVNNHAIHQI